jgi:hypothetical protein
VVLGQVQKGPPRKPGQGFGRSGVQQSPPLGLQNPSGQHWPSEALQQDVPLGQQVDGPQHTAVGCWPVSGQQRSPAGQQIGSPGGQQISQLQGVEPIG